MPFYEYTKADGESGCDSCTGVFEERQPITAAPLEKCPSCGGKVVRIPSLIAGVIWKGRQMNQYGDCRGAKYWRDKNGVRHEVGPGDGDVNSPTVSNRVTASPEQIEARKKADRRRSQDAFTAKMRQKEIQKAMRARGK